MVKRTCPPSGHLSSDVTSGGQSRRGRLLRLYSGVFGHPQASAVLITAGKPRWHITGRQRSVILGELVLSQRAVAEFLEGFEKIIQSLAHSAEVYIHVYSAPTKSLDSCDRMSCVLCLYWDFLLTTDWILLLLWNQIHHPDQRLPSPSNLQA